MFNRFLIVVASFILAVYSGFSQSGIKKAKKAYADFDYFTVEEYAPKGKIDDIDLIRKLADSYKMTGEYKKAEKYFEIAANHENKTPSDLFAYIQILKMNSKYEQAENLMDFYTDFNPDDSRVELFQMNRKYYTELLKDKKQFVVYPVFGNSAHQDFGVVWYKNKVVFASSRQPLSYLTRIWNGNRLPYLDMYTAKINPKNELKSVKKFPAFNKKYHEGPASFNKKGNYIVFSCDNYNGKNKEGVRMIKLCEAELEKGGKWGDKKNLPFNSTDYSCGQPSLTSDGNTLYFVSDMPGGFGGTDIYKTTRNEQGKWSKPVNLGEKINTEGNEMFPYIHESGLFFFSSDGRPGLGGLDVFAAMIIDDFISKPINVGIPANSNKDDFSMILDAEQKKGFFSSNRDGGKGSDDIYAFDLLKPFNFGKMIKGTVKDNKGNLLEDAAVFLMNKKGNILDKVCTKKDGTYILFADENTEYMVMGKKEKYFDDKKNVNTNTNETYASANLILERDPDYSIVAFISDAKSKLPIENAKIIFKGLKGKNYNFNTTASGTLKSELTDVKTGDSLNFIIEISKTGYVTKTINFKWKIIKPGEQKINEHIDLSINKIELGGDLAKMSNLGNIYFDLAKYNIRPDAAVELDKIVKIMNENPDMVVELGSHTDCRSSKQYNLTLSDKRAKSSVDYIKARITNPSRITGKGYGENKLLNNCACEGSKPSPCTEEEHAINRRTEFIILKF